LLFISGIPGFDSHGARPRVSSGSDRHRTLAVPVASEDEPERIRFETKRRAQDVISPDILTRCISTPGQDHHQFSPATPVLQSLHDPGDLTPTLRWRRSIDCAHQLYTFDCVHIAQFTPR
jgi:hypothetical protein